MSRITDNDKSYPFFIARMVQDNVGSLEAVQVVLATPRPAAKGYLAMLETPVPMLAVVHSLVDRRRTMRAGLSASLIAVRRELLVGMESIPLELAIFNADQPLAFPSPVPKLELR